jgi:RHS repeat-associated protein
VYGEGQPSDQALNLRGKLYQQFDGAGVVTHTLFDFKGNLLSGSRQLVLNPNFTQVVDWSQSNALDTPFTSSTTYDALNRPITVTAPDGSVLSPAYNQTGLLTQVNGVLATPGSTARSTQFVSNISYDAKGQRQAISYGNGTSTVYSHDPLTFRLMNLYTARSSSSFPGDDPNPPKQPRGIQNLSYSYDPVGNVTQIRDSAQQTIYYNNAKVAPVMSYTYDARYRLIQATGREAIGQVSQPQPSYDDSPRMNQPLPNDWTAMRNYTEGYQYDVVGNFLALIHGTASGNWTRTFAYDESVVPPRNNRLTSTSVGATKEIYSYDAHGNMLTMPQLQSMAWDFKDQLQATQKQVVNTGAAPQTYYVYDAAGQRVRKINVAANGTIINERIYLNGLEVYREYGGGTTTLERQTLHVMDDKQRIALVENLMQGNDGSPPQLIRYQFSNHLGSASLELDSAANIISYEEYCPYGSTSYQAVDSSVKAPAKRYRYTGKERDEETGFTYHGARYYAPWLGRWTSCDPKGASRDVNLYCYVANRPSVFVDPDGRMLGLPPVVIPSPPLPPSVIFQAPASFAGGSAAAPVAAAPVAAAPAAAAPVAAAPAVAAPAVGVGTVLAAGSLVLLGVGFIVGAAYKTQKDWDDYKHPTVTYSSSAPAGASTTPNGPPPVARILPGAADPNTTAIAPGARNPTEVAKDPTNDDQRRIAPPPEGKSGPITLPGATDPAGGSLTVAQKSHSGDKVPYRITGKQTDFDAVRGTSVYVLKDQAGNVLYVGKGDVWDRLRKHITDPDKTPWFGEIGRVEIVGTDLTNSQALALEQDQIHQLDPHYNKDRTPYETEFGKGKDYSADLPRPQAPHRFNVNLGQK